jgi:predicted nucleotidyltransferase component of viral defense system
MAQSVSGNEVIKVKLEVDTTPPPYATFERKYRLMPIPYEINLYDMPSLFAGKLHAVICRAWKSRVKGRDLYDYVFYLSRNVPVNLRHLNARLLDSGFEGAREDLSLDEIKGILRRRFDAIDFDQAREDVLPFIKNPSAVDVWSRDFFVAITENLKA